MDSFSDNKCPSDSETSSTAVLITSPELTRQTRSKPIRHYFVFSLFSAICCWPTGLIAIGYSLKSSAKADVNLHDKSRLYSRRAFFWNIISVVLGIILFILTLALYYQIIVTTKMRIKQMQINYGRRSNDVDPFVQSISNAN